MNEGEDIEADAQPCSCCAFCGIAEIDDIKLMSCDGCDLVKYCSDECREDHKSEHEEDCKKGAAELRDALLAIQATGRQSPWRLPYLQLTSAARKNEIWDVWLLQQSDLQRMRSRQSDARERRELQQSYLHWM